MFEICGESHVTFCWRQSTLHEVYSSEKCQIITELVAYLYTSNVETACESMEFSLLALNARISSLEIRCTTL